MPEDTEGIRRRLERLEELFTLILLLEIGPEVPEAYERLFSFLRSSRERPSDQFYWENLFQYLLQAGYPRRYFELKDRLLRLESRHEETERAGRAIPEEMSTFRSQIAHATESLGTLQLELHSYLAAQSLGLDLDLVPLHRFLPVRIYLPEADHHQIGQISEALTAFSDALGFVVADDFPAETGSWYKRWFTKTKEAATRPEVEERLKKVERAVELVALQKPQAAIDKDQAEAAAALLHGLENIPNAATQIGSILILKYTDQNGPRVIARSLTQAEMIHLEKNQHLFRNPADILKALSALQEPNKGSSRKKLR